MALQMVLGDLSIDKKTPLIQSLFQLKQKDPKAKLFYLVPDHIKFDMETRLLKEIQAITKQPHAATVDIQVVSFKRLAWSLFNQSPSQKSSLSDIGLTMLIKQIVMENQDQLLVYRGQGKHLGFIEKLKSLFQELMQGNIDPVSFFEMNHLDLIEGSFDLNHRSKEGQDNKDADTLIPDLSKQRIYELAELYHKFHQALTESEWGNFREYQDLMEWLRQQGNLDHHYLVIDHHYFFNGQQYQLITSLIQTFKQVWITLPISKIETLNQEWNPMTRLALDTYQRLVQDSRLFNLDRDSDWDLGSPQSPIHSDLLNAAHAYRLSQNPYLDARLLDLSAGPIDCWQFDTPQDELWHVANQIHHLVINKQYRYQDIQVLTRNLDLYQQFIGPYFNNNEIPYFFDHETTMAQSPLVLWLEGLLNLSKRSWSYADLMLVLKSDLLIPEWVSDDLTEARYQKALVENILLANGYFSYRFHQEQFIWKFSQEERPYINSLGHETEFNHGQIVNQWRAWLIDHVYHPLQAWKQAQTGQEAATWLYQLFVSTGIRDRLIHQRDLAIHEGDLDLSRRLEQTWQTLMNTLDDFQLLYTTKSLSLGEFSDLLLTGLREATYLIIPPTLDQVKVASIESPRVQPAKITFILGLDSNTYPLTASSSSLLSNQDRELMAQELQAHQYLFSGEQQANFLEPLLGYQMLLSATDHLYLCFAVNVNGQQVQLSHPFARWLHEIGLEVKRFGPSQQAFMGQDLSPNQLGRPKMLVSPMLNLLRRSYLMSALPQDLSLEVTAYLYQSLPDWDRILNGMFTLQPLAKNLKTETALALFGHHLTASVSKIEAYFQDPFSHYLIYGLRLRERQLYQLDAAKAGDYYHSILDSFLKNLIDQGIKLHELDEGQLSKLVQQVVNQTEKELTFNLFDAHPRMRAIKEQMDQNLVRFIRFSSQQAKIYQPQTLYTEAVFGLSSKDLKGISYRLDSGGYLNLTGKIDRIDSLPKANQRLGFTNNSSNNIPAQEKSMIQIIDYKSGNKTFSLSDAYYGHDLQIATYLKVALENISGSQPLGAFYQPITQGYQEATQEIVQAIDQKQTNNYQLEANPLRGFLSVDPDQLTQVDGSILENGKSIIYPAKVKKSGDYFDSTLYLDPDLFEKFQTLLDKKFLQAGNEIQTGQIQIAPYKDNPYTLSLQPQYRVISGFDATEHYHLYRHKTITSKDILNTWRKGDEISDD